MKIVTAAAFAALLAAPALAQSLTTYESLPEGFLGQSFDLNGVHYHDCNGVSGVFPDGSTFTAADIGNNFIIENSALFYNDHPTWGSPVNTLTFGTAYIPGPNLSLGAFASAWLDIDHPIGGISFDLAYYENGPWGGIRIVLDAYREESLIGQTFFTIPDGGGRDNIAVRTFSFCCARFERFHLYAQYNDHYSAPRLLVDNLTLIPLHCGSADFNNDGDIGTDQDIEAFFRCLAGSCCPTCPQNPDFDNDGDIGTDADIEAFFRILAGNPC